MELIVAIRTLLNAGLTPATVGNLCTVLAMSHRATDEQVQQLMDRVSTELSLFVELRNHASELHGHVAMELRVIETLLKEAGVPTQPCPRCCGRGWIEGPLAWELASSTTASCPHCGGRGKVPGMSVAMAEDSASAILRTARLSSCPICGIPYAHGCICK